MLNKAVSDIMNAAISYKYRSITFSAGKTSRKNFENLVEQIHNFIVENDTCNLYADDIFSKIYKRILGKVLVLIMRMRCVDKLVCDTRTKFCSSYLFRIEPGF